MRQYTSGNCLPGGMTYKIAEVKEAGEDGGACLSCRSKKKDILLGHGE